MRVFDIGGGEGPEVVSNRILTVPNLLSLARLLILPWLYIELSRGTSAGLARGLAIGVVFGATDWVDGYVARRFNQVTKLGKILDPVSDRLFIGTIGVALVMSGLLPWWPVIAIIARDVLFLVVGIFLIGGVGPPPVTRLGKAATFGLMWSFPFLLMAGIIGTPQDPQPVLYWLGWAILVINLVLYYIVAGQYARAVIQGRDALPEDD